MLSDLLIALLLPLMFSVRCGQAQRVAFPKAPSVLATALDSPITGGFQATRHECSGNGRFSQFCTFYNLVMWKHQFYYITKEEVTIPEVSEGWHAPWHPYGEALLPEHVTVISPAELPWGDGTTAEHIEDALLYNWLDQANMFHVMMETGNFIYATACKLLGACTHATSHYQILATGHFEDGHDNGLPAGHESLKCLSSKAPCWIGDSRWDNKVLVINKTAVGLGVPCNEEGSMCEWDSISYMQPDCTTGHRQLMLDCLAVPEQPNAVSQHHTQVTLVQRLFKRSRSMLNVLEMESRISATGAQVDIVNMEGKTLREQAQILVKTHVFILVHGAAMALYMFLPRNAAIVEIQHSYAHASNFPNQLHGRTVLKYAEMKYHYGVLVLQNRQDIVLQKDRVTNDVMYQKMSKEEQLQLWEQGLCPVSQESLMLHCVQNWIFLAGNLVVDLNELMKHYSAAWQSLPSGTLQSV